MNQEILKKLRTERRRGWILKLLYEARPNPVELTSLQKMLDQVNFPLSIRQLIQEIDFIRSEDLLRIFPLAAETELDAVGQSKLLQRCVEIEDECRKVSIRLRTRGTNFQEGNLQIIGIERIY